MGEVFEIFSKRQKTEDEIRTEAEAVPAEEERFRELEQYLGKLDLAEALKIDKESPEAEGIVDLDSFSYEKAKSLGGKTVDKIVFEEVAKRLEQGAEEITPEMRRALNNYIQLTDIEAAIIERASIALPDPTRSRRVGQTEGEIRNKKIEILKSSIGEKLAGRIEDLQIYLDEGWKSKDWSAELDRRLENIEMPDVFNPVLMLDKAEFVISQLFPASFNDAVDLGRVQKIREAKKAFAEGNPEFLTHPQNRFLDSAAEGLRIGRSYVAEKRTAETINFLRDKIKEQLIRQEITVLETSAK